MENEKILEVLVKLSAKVDELSHRVSKLELGKRVTTADLTDSPFVNKPLHEVLSQIEEKEFLLDERLEDIEDLLDSVDLSRLPDVIAELNERVEVLESPFTLSNSGFLMDEAQLDEDKAAFGEDLIKVIIRIAKTINEESFKLDRLENGNKIDHLALKLKKIEEEIKGTQKD